MQKTPHTLQRVKSSGGALYLLATAERVAVVPGAFGNMIETMHFLCVPRAPAAAAGPASPASGADHPLLSQGWCRDLSHVMRLQKASGRHRRRLQEKCSSRVWN